MSARRLAIVAAVVLIPFGAVVALSRPPASTGGQVAAARTSITARAAASSLALKKPTTDARPAPVSGRASSATKRRSAPISKRVPTSSTPRTVAATTHPAGLVATPVTAHVAVWTSPGGHVGGTLRATTFGGPTWRPVLAQRPGWTEIRRMGDGSPVGWVHTTDVRLASDPWSIVVDLATGQLSFLDGGRVVLTSPVAHGRPSMPTPSGSTFLAADTATTGADALESPVLRPTGYHSLSPLARAEFPALHRGGAAAVTGIHGWESETANPSLWRDGHGLPASHGCLRLPTGPATSLLAQLPDGTPVTILAG